MWPFFSLFVQQRTNFNLCPRSAGNTITAPVPSLLAGFSSEFCVKYAGGLKKHKVKNKPVFYAEKKNILKQRFCPRGGVRAPLLYRVCSGVSCALLGAILALVLCLRVTLLCVLLKAAHLHRCVHAAARQRGVNPLCHVGRSRSTPDAARQCRRLAQHSTASVVVGLSVPVRGRFPVLRLRVLRDGSARDSGGSSGAARHAAGSSVSGGRRVPVVHRAHGRMSPAHVQPERPCSNRRSARLQGQSLHYIRTTLYLQTGLSQKTSGSTMARKNTSTNCKITRRKFRWNL